MKPLTKAQWEVLDRVCRTNGGGVTIRCTVRDGAIAVPSHAPTAALFAKGLIQGKSNSFSTVVHTSEGLRLWRERNA